jgi:hypothetical protein
VSIPQEKLARLEALERKIERLRRRLAVLEQFGDRLGWLRVGIFFGGFGLSILAFVLVGWWLFLPGIFLTIALFSVAVFFHRRITRSIARHTILQHIAASQVARIRLDWNALPTAIADQPGSEHPFDLDLDISGNRSLHRLINTAISSDGSHRLQGWLLNTHPDLATIEQRQALVRELASMTIFRDRLQVKAILAAQQSPGRWEGKQLLHWLDQRRASPNLLPYLWLSLALSLSTIVLLVLNLVSVLPQLWVITLLISILYLFTTNNLRGELFDDATTLSDAFAQLSVAFDYLETSRYGTHTRLKDLCAPFLGEQSRRPSALLKSIAGIATATALRKNMLLWILINVLVPWDFYFAHRFYQRKAQIAKHLPTWLDTWFELEALCSLATFAYLNPDYILPNVTAFSGAGSEPLFEAKGLGHPLIPIEQKVVNDFTLERIGRIDIITGSNMSGKSTFLRTVGVNLCLAFAGGPVNAAQFHSSLFRLFSCIRVTDSVTEGYSYFYAEVKRLRALLDELETTSVGSSDGAGNAGNTGNTGNTGSEAPLFFLIDEIFKGTNNRERLIGSESYISALAAKPCLGIVTTHDLELVRLAEHLPEVRNYHFREDVIDGHMTFDYILRDGPSPTTNALKIMQLEGLPISLETKELH